MIQQIDDIRWNPGGWVAKKKGCTCPRLDNGEGAGSPLIDPEHTSGQYLDRQPVKDRTFIINRDCPLHADIARHSPTSRQDNS